MRLASTGRVAGALMLIALSITRAGVQCTRRAATATDSQPRWLDADDDSLLPSPDPRRRGLSPILRRRICRRELWPWPFQPPRGGRHTDGTALRPALCNGRAGNLGTGMTAPAIAKLPSIVGPIRLGPEPVAAGDSTKSARHVRAHIAGASLTS